MGLRLSTGIGPARVSIGGGSGLFIAFFYAMAMLMVYTVYFAILCLIWAFKIGAAIAEAAWAAWQKRQARIAWEREQQRQYEAGLAYRADQQHAEYLAGGTGLPDDPWSPDSPRWQRPA